MHEKTFGSIGAARLRHTAGKPGGPLGLQPLIAKGLARVNIEPVGALPVLTADDHRAVMASGLSWWVTPQPSWWRSKERHPMDSAER